MNQTVTFIKPKTRKIRNTKRIKFRNLSSGMSIEDLEERIEEMAAKEEAMTMYEHCLEIG